MLFGAKIFIWALLGLLVPLFLHLWNKQEPKVISIGSTELMESFESNQARRFRVSDWFLLLWRCFILGTLAFLLMQPYWLKSTTVAPPVYYKHIVLVDPILLEEAAIQESIVSQNKPTFLLTTDFPKLALDSLTVTTQQTTKRGYWQLLSQIDFADTVSVFGINEASNFLGEQATLPFVLNWRNVPKEASQQQLLKASAITEKDFLLTILESSPTGNKTLKIKKNKTDKDIQLLDQQLIYNKDTVDLTLLDTLNIVFQYNRNTKEAWQLIEAALKSMEAHTNVPLELNTELNIELENEKIDWFFCLDKTSENASCPDSKNTIYYEYNKQINIPVLQVKNNQLYLMGNLRRSNPQISSLPIVLSEYLLGIDKVNLSQQSIDKRLIAEEQIQVTTQTKQQKVKEAAIVLEKERKHFPIWLFLVFLIIVERVVVHSKYSK